VLEIERVGEDRFAARGDGFGGVTLGCATLAAALSTDRALHSLHSYFLRAVPLDRPLELVVERMRDGRRFSHRRVQVRDEGQLVCEVLASFAAGGAGFEAQDVILAPETRPPEALPSEADSFFLPIDLPPHNRASRKEPRRAPAVERRRQPAPAAARDSTRAAGRIAG
jgi:acyl-CoA thioesterase-2